MSIDNKLIYLNETKAEIKDAIEEKGVTVGDIPFRQYKNKIKDISTGVEVSDGSMPLFVKNEWEKIYKKAPIRVSELFFSGNADPSKDVFLEWDNTERKYKWSNDAFYLKYNSGSQSPAFVPSSIASTTSEVIKFNIAPVSNIKMCLTRLSLMHDPALRFELKLDDSTPDPMHSTNQNLVFFHYDETQPEGGTDLNAVSSWWEFIGNGFTVYKVRDINEEYPLLETGDTPPDPDFIGDFIHREMTFEEGYYLNVPNAPLFPHGEFGISDETLDKTTYRINGNVFNGSEAFFPETDFPETEPTYTRKAALAGISGTEVCNLYIVDGGWWDNAQYNTASDVGKLAEEGFIMPPSGNGSCILLWTGGGEDAFIDTSGYGSGVRRIYEPNPIDPTEIYDFTLEYRGDNPIQILFNKPEQIIVSDGGEEIIGGEWTNKGFLLGLPKPKDTIGMTDDYHIMSRITDKNGNKHNIPLVEHVDNNIVTWHGEKEISEGIILKISLADNAIFNGVNFAKQELYSGAVIYIADGDGSPIDYSEFVGSYAVINIPSLKNLPCEGAGTGDYRVRFIDYDGTYEDVWVNEGGDATPPNFDHSVATDFAPALTFQEWNKPYTNITEDTDIGAVYIPTDGKTHFYLQITGGTGKDITLYAQHNGGRNIVIKWGDGTTFSSTATSITASHTFAEYGVYHCTIENTLMGDFQLGQGTESTPFCGGSNQQMQDALMAIYLGGKVQTSSYSFSSNHALKYTTLPDSVTSIAASAFSSCYSLRNITLSDSVTSIGSEAFYSCSSLRNITLPDSVTTIKYRAFNRCYSLRNITLSDSVTSIGSQAFYYCYSLRNITLSDSVTSIADRAFYSCYSIKKVLIEGNTVKTLSTTNAFTGIPKSTIFFVKDELVEDYKDETNWTAYADQIMPMSEEANYFD